MPTPAIVSSFASLLQPFARCFTRPSYASFVDLVSGWLLQRGRHTTTRVVQAAQKVGEKHLCSFHRFWSRARWSPDAVGRVLVEQIALLQVRTSPAVAVAPASPASPPQEPPLEAVVDDTLARHQGQHIASSGLHRDPLLSKKNRPLFHWGHVWVVVGLNVALCGKTWCLPVLCRLYRSKTACKRAGLVHRKKTELAAEMIRLLASWVPHRRVVVAGDGGYSNRTVMRDRPAKVDVVGRGWMNAALYAPPPPRQPGQMGRPRVRGAKLPTPAQQAADPKAPWTRVSVTVYGRTVRVQTLTIDALWYGACGSEEVRLVVVRGFPGHKKDDVFVATDPTMTPKQVIETYARRWPMEPTFHATKDLGLEDPQNRTEVAVRRTAPMALWVYSLVVLWYAKVGQSLPAAPCAKLPWDRPDRGVCFADMLETLRRASWVERLSAGVEWSGALRKALDPLLDAVASAA